MTVTVKCTKCGKRRRIPNDTHKQFKEEMLRRGLCECGSNQFSLKAHLTFSRKMVHGVMKSE